MDRKLFLSGLKNSLRIYKYDHEIISQYQSWEIENLQFHSLQHLTESLQPFRAMQNFHAGLYKATPLTLK